MTPTRYFTAESVWRSWTGVGVVPSADAPATCGPAANSASLGSRRSLFSGSSQGLYTSIKHRERGRARGRRSHRPLRLLCCHWSSPLNHCAKKRSQTASAGPPEQQRPARPRCASWGGFSAACLHYPHTIISRDPYSPHPMSSA